MKDKVIEERLQYAKEFEKYWRSIIDEQKRNQAVIGEKRKRNATEEERQQQTKKTRKDLKGSSLTDAIHHTLSNLIYLQLRRNKSMLNGRALEDVIGEPDYIVVDENYEVVIPFEYKTRWTLKIPSNEDIVVSYIQEKKYREGRLTNSKGTSIYNSINQIYGRYAPYIDKPKLITNEESSNSGTFDNEQKDDKEFKYKQTLSLKEPNVVTRSRSTQIE
ncbi:hypothetical protein C2G38_2239966 [Gigaspora rosea]|uniref:Uncharacterized protein n=1 Tax=Gigaspora rosea TaxID=44941 RepID=A0A397W8K4_9GLOM|nr:hypothetical protein C2G38_2239966 [Gigaspora rosea]